MRWTQFRGSRNAWYFDGIRRYDRGSHNDLSNMESELNDVFDKSSCY